MDIQALVTAQRAYFNTGATLPLSARRAALQRLRETITAHEGDITAALRSDLNKAPTESYMCEAGLTLSERSFVEKQLGRWMADRPHLTPLAQFPARSFTVREPYGVVLIMSPWNYPFLLTVEPLIGAIAAGNCCVVKPSAYSPAPRRSSGGFWRSASRRSLSRWWRGEGRKIRPCWTRNLTISSSPAGWRWAKR